MAENKQGCTPIANPNFCPDAGWVLADINRSVDYRKEYYKYSIGIATALLAFSISFPPALTAIDYVSLVRVAWISLGISILCGVSVHYVWSKFFISYRDFDNRGFRDTGQKKRKILTKIRRVLEYLHFFSLLIGVLGIAVFASINYQHVALHASDSPARPMPATHSN